MSLKQRKRWSTEVIAEIASQYRYRNEFKKDQPQAYDAAHNRGILDHVCRHMEYKDVSWTYEKAELEARQYPTRVSMKKNNPALYQVVLKRWPNLLDHTPVHQFCFDWTDEKLESVARLYSSRTEFYHGNTAAYKMIQKAGRLDEFCSHMKTGEFTSRNNLFYIWKAIEWSTEVCGVYKVGISSTDARWCRIKTISNRMGVTPKVIIKQELPPSLHATDLEDIVLSMGAPVVNITESEGHTELRYFTEVDLDEIRMAVDNFIMA